MLLLWLLACTSPDPSSPIAEVLGDTAWPLFGRDAGGVQDFEYTVENPEYPNQHGPRVRVDAAHANYHTLDDRYAAFGVVAEADGYRVGSYRQRFTAADLERVDILVIANALSADTEAWVLPVAPALDSAEVQALSRWIRHGGRLLLLVDHMPFPGAVHPLAESLGLLFYDGFAENRTGSTQLIFTATRGLGTHVTLQGRSADEAIHQVKVFTGSAFRPAPGTQLTPLLTLPADGRVVMPTDRGVIDDNTPQVPSTGLLMGAAMAFGRGRVVTFSEAGMFSAQVREDGTPKGFNDPDAADNAPLLLNLLRWLSEGL